MKNSPLNCKLSKLRRELEVTKKVWTLFFSFFKKETFSYLLMLVFWAVSTPKKPSTTTPPTLPTFLTFTIKRNPLPPLWIFPANSLFHEYFRLQAGINLFKVNNGNTRRMCNLSSKITIKTSAQGHWRRSDLFIINFKQIAHIFLVFLLLTLNK